MRPKLSICIPNYNRGVFIGETLQSVVDQISDGVEVVVSDNASTDNSDEVIASFQRRFPCIRYYRSGQNVGFDKNVLKVVELAKGDYCWFLGSDDRIESKGIETVLKALEKYPDLGGICLGFVPYDKELRQKGLAWNPTLGKYHQTILFEDSNECFSVLGHYFGFFSAQVVNREVWMEVFRTGSWQAYCEGFVHVYMIGSILKKRPRWLFLPQQCVGWRSGIDVYLASFGFYERLRFDVKGCDKIFRALLGKRSPAYRAIMRTGAAVHTSAILLNARLHNIDLSSRIKMAKLCFRYYGGYLFFWTNIIPILIMPVSLLRFLKYVVRAYKKAFWSPINRD